MVDVVLSEPGVEGDLVDTEGLRGLLDLSAFADQSDGPGTELWRVRAGHTMSLP